MQEVPEAIFFWSPNLTLWMLFKKIRLYVRHNFIARLPVRWIELPLINLGASMLFSVLAISFLGGWGLLAFPLAFAVNGLLRSYLKVGRRWPLLKKAKQAQPQLISHLAIGLWAPTLYVTLDVAALLGVWDWILKDKLGLAPETFPTPKIQSSPRTFDS